MFHVLWQRRFLSRFWFLCFEECCTAIYCSSTKLQNSKNVCMVGVQTCPPDVKHILHPHFFVSFQHITFKLGNFTTLMCLFQQCQNYGYMPTGPCQKVKKSWKGLFEQLLPRMTLLCIVEKTAPTKSIKELFSEEYTL